MRILMVLSVFLSLAAPVSAELKGAWRPESYVLKDGSKFRVSGLIFFSETDWTVLFFVEGENGAVRRGSSEGGTYTLDGDELTFTHIYHLSAGDAVGSLAEAPLRMSVRDQADAATEPCRIEVSEHQLIIFFPSGNEMHFSKSSGF